MKTANRVALQVAACMLTAGSAGLAHAAIANTKHNLGTSGSGLGNNSLTAGTAEICVFCHTPHASNPSVSAPLWNKNRNTGTYTIYSSSTMEASVGQPGGISLACLSCHDGTQSMDVVINAPGSGGYNSPGIRMSSTTWGGPRVSGTGVMSGGVAMLGTDLSNDHPIGIRYCGNANVSNAGCSDPDFFSYTVTGSGGYVNRTLGSNIVAGRDKGDMWLYNNGGGLLMVECASCHDPHSGNQTFLRASNSGSQVCLTCHNK